MNLLESPKKLALRIVKSTLIDFGSLKGPFTQIKIEPIWLSNRLIAKYLS